MTNTLRFSENSGHPTALRAFGLPGSMALAIVLFSVGSSTASNLIATPAGLLPGDTFRIIFITDATTTAANTDISYYNTFVSNDANAEAGGGANEFYYGNLALTWDAIGSTATTNAIDNIGITNARIFLTNGLQVATSDSTSSGGLWSGDTLINTISSDLNGIGGDSSLVWTGTDINGIGDFYPLGLNGTNDNPVSIAGAPVFPGGGGWLDNSAQLQSNTYPIYGISQQLTVPAVPEPASIVTMGMLACCAAAAAYVRRLARARHLK